MKKIVIILLAVLIIIFSALAVRFILGGPEDSWICVDGQWTKHGVPSSSAPETGCGDENINCTEYQPENCPTECVVCPPCIECSSISCQTQEFCENIGFNKTWYETIKTQNDIVENCQKNNGAWLGEFQECEYIGKELCDQLNGEFFECESACRHNLDAEICTTQCVPVCKFAKKEITSFQDCAEAGNLIMESYPRQCQAGGKTFVEGIGNELEKMNLIQIYNPRPNQIVNLPLTIKGKARGNWFFEASFPVKLYDQKNQLIAQTIASAKSDWMTQDFVEFEAILPSTILSQAGQIPVKLVLEKDNPSGLPENEDSLYTPLVLNLPETIKINLYFGNSQLDPNVMDCSKVFEISRIIPKTEAIGRAALEELLKGPTATEENQGYSTSINDNVKIQSLTIKDGIAKIDFDQTLQDKVGGSCRVTAIRAQITQTLKQFPTVKDVVISINSRTEDILQP